jgi:hypothetical protein
MIEDHAAMMRMIAKDPKLAGHMLKMHADIMRAVPDVMTKYGKEMASGEWQSYQTGSNGAQTSSNPHTSSATKY